MSAPIAALEEQLVAALPFPLERVPDRETEDYDARLTADVVADDSVLGTLYLERETPIELKSCRAWIEVTGSNGSRRRGRWWVSRAAHTRLQELGGAYLLTVLDAHDVTHDHLLAPADVVDDLLADRWTGNGTGGGSREESAQLPWGSLLDDPEGSP